MAEFSKLTMALFANKTAADLKRAISSCTPWGLGSPSRVAPRADQCLGGQFACAPMSYSMFSTIVDVTNGCWGVFVGCVLAMRKGFMQDLILSYCRVRYFDPQPFINAASGKLPANVKHHNWS